MVRIVVDGDMGKQLAELKGPADLFDAAGRSLGQFVPKRKSKLAHIEAQCPYTREELDAMAAETGGQSLPEIWKDLGRK